jgi:heavy metal efflux system protein
LIIAALLYATFHDVKQMLLILLIVPLALVGGIAALWIRGINLNLIYQPASDSLRSSALPS